MKTAEGKVPYRITLNDASLFAFAGIWEEWQAEDGRDVKSFSIITVPASDTIRDIHDRMPAILTPEEENNWIREMPTTETEKMLKSYNGELTSIRVSNLVNSPKNDSEKVLNPEFNK
jgi:putative SOS response-associated peptidase YedK